MNYFKEKLFKILFSAAWALAVGAGAMEMSEAVRVANT